MKQQRIIFLKKQKGTSIMGITQLDFVVEGQQLAAERGGGRIGSMVLKDGMIYVRKVDAEGKPHRQFGAVAMSGGKVKQLVADGIAFPAHLAAGMLFDDVEDEIAEPAKPAEPKPEVDPPPAKPVQQQGQQRR
jgi:hypothetical protein